ncbi:MAG: hypothetical protein ACQESP_03935 [Candidatus Muiribacteriota bacterium]
MKVKSALFISFLLILSVNIYPWNKSGTFIPKTPPEETNLNENEILTYNFLYDRYDKTKFIKVIDGDRINAYVEAHRYEDFKEQIEEAVYPFKENHVNTLEKYFGTVPYNEINIYFYEVQDTYSDEGLTYYAGYFDSYIDEHYNSIFIDLYPTFTFENTKQIKGIIAHEFQHLIHNYYDSDEKKWFNEGMSELATYLIGGENQLHVGQYIEFPYVSMSEWNDKLPDYGKVYLFFRYLIYRKGVDIISRLVKCKNNGMGSLRSVLGVEGFNTFFKQWATAISLNTEEEIKYNIVGLDFQVQSVALIETDSPFKLSLPAYSFAKIDVNFKHRTKHNLKINKERISPFEFVLAFYNRNQLERIAEYDGNEVKSPEVYYDRIKLIIVNPTMQDAEEIFNLQQTEPEIEIFENPYFDNNRLVQMKGNEIINVSLNGKKVMFEQINLKHTVFSVNINTTSQNHLEYEYIYDDRIYKGEYKFSAGEI